MNITLPKSKLHTITNEKGFRKSFKKNGIDCEIYVKIRYDDTCQNGHNTFSITGIIYENRVHRWGGCIHKEIKKHFPNLRKFIKWHLCSSNGPLHYVANTVYHAGVTEWKKERNFNAARSCAIWPEATDEQLSLPSHELEALLVARLPKLMADFKQAIEELGFEY